MTTNQDIIVCQVGRMPVILQTSLGAMFFSQSVLQDMDLFQQTQRGFLYTTTHLATQTSDEQNKRIDLTLSLTGNESTNLPSCVTKSSPRLQSTSWQLKEFCFGLIIWFPKEMGL